MKTLIAQLRGVQRGFETQICTLLQYKTPKTEMAMLIEAFVSIGAVIQYLEPASAQIGFEEDVLPTSVRNIMGATQIDFQASLSVGKELLSKIEHGSAFVPDVLISALSKASFVCLDSALCFNAELQTPMLTSLQELIDCTVLSAEICGVAAQRSSQWDEALALLAELSPKIQKCLSKSEDELVFDVDVRPILRTIAFIADYRGKTLSSIGQMTLRNIFYIQN